MALGDEFEELEPPPEWPVWEPACVFLILLIVSILVGVHRETFR